MSLLIDLFLVTGTGGLDGLTTYCLYFSGVPVEPLTPSINPLFLAGEPDLPGDRLVPEPSLFMSRDGLSLVGLFTNFMLATK